MRVFDILGPVMIGPSSSHTAGAVKIGLVTGRLLGAPVKEAEILLHGSFASTGVGHGTDRAIVAGLLGMQPDDPRIPDSYAYARKAGLVFSIGTTHLRGAHPNTAALRVTSSDGRKLEIVASSVGGGRINVCQIDGIDTNFSGDYNTLVVHNLDQPGHVAEVTGALAKGKINIATMQLYRNVQGGYAVMVIECDQPIPADLVAWLQNVDGIIKVTYLNLDNEEEA